MNYWSVNMIKTPLDIGNFIKDKDIKYIPNDWHITEDFTWNEFLIKQTEKPNLRILLNLKIIADVLQRHRGILKKPITITSGWRSESYNKKIGGAANSYHVQGLAVDFVVKDYTPQEVQKRLDPIHNGGMEYAPTWTHIDARGKKARFKP